MSRSRPWATRMPLRGFAVQWPLPLMAASQRPTQKAMGHGAVRSQVESSEYAFRERKDVDLILGQGMLHACWDARNLNAPSRFLVSAPEHRYLTASEKRRPPFHGRTGRS